MLKINLTYFLYGAIVVTALAWVPIGLIMAEIYIHNPGMGGPPYGNRIFLVLSALPWVTAIGFSWLSLALRRKGQSNAAWGTSFLSLALWVLYVVGTGILLLPREL